MKIVDLRPLMVRRFTRTDNLPASPRGFGRLSGYFSDGIIKRKVDKRPLNNGLPLLVSVGNLALGGTGKTPVVMAMARDLAAAGLQGAILTRGYGSSLGGPLVVEKDNLLAGDEARMMAGQLEEIGWPVVQSRNRPQGLNFLKNHDPDLKIVLLEDAFQTGGLARDVDLVILDSWTVLKSTDSTVLKPVTGPVFPFGPWRETARGAERATALLVEGNSELPKLSFTGQQIFSFNRYVELRLVKGHQLDPNHSKLALLSGIARPEKFESSISNLLSSKAVVALRCQDHVKYTARLLGTILEEMDEAGAEVLITTAKDWVKLSSVWNDLRPVMVLDMNLAWNKKNALNHWLVERVTKLEANQSGSTTP